MARVYGIEDYKSPVRLAEKVIWSTQVYFWTLCIIFVVQVWFLSGGSPSGNHPFFTPMVMTVGFVHLLASLVSGWFYLAWFRRGIINVRALGVRGVRASATGAWLWHFVPLANLVMPFRVMKQIAIGSQPGVWEMDHVKKHPNPKGLGWWWGLLLLGSLGVEVDALNLSAQTLDYLRWVWVFQMSLQGASSWICMSLIQSYSYLQDEKAEEILDVMDEVGEEPSPG
ncbi:DUF4328 domain-containing protein [Mucisphaera sp.]|uniref:DUF4328 domain-containing protein n=1 Tax=Mucisphaera sp. TaxID=2913024 RepID=UPI003D0D2D6C